MSGENQSEDQQVEAAFGQLQQRLAPLFDRIMDDNLLPRTVVVIPSLSLDDEVLQKITGVPHYEERMLSLLMLLRMPRTRVVFVTSQPLPESIVDYYLHLLPGVPYRHARERLVLLTCYDRTSKPLTRKILDRPHLLARIRKAIGSTADAHMICFNVTALERDLALALDVPIFGCDPALISYGSKSGSRHIFTEAGVKMPDGYEDLASIDEAATALVRLKQKHPALRRAVVKINEGFSGEGNALFSFDGAPEGPELEAWVANHMHNLAFEAADMTWQAFAEKFAEMQGIVETFVEGEGKQSPSAQFRVYPGGRIEFLSSHDQVLGGPSGQQFLGCRFPADPAYRRDIQTEALKAAKKLAEKGVIGRFGIDFISVPTGDGWDHYAIEINLRKGGTTHPFLMLQYLTNGVYNPDNGEFTTGDGRTRFYIATDNLESDAYRGLTPDDLIDIAVCNGIHFDAANQSGVVFHLIGALSEYGKLGMVAIGRTPEAAQRLYDETVAILDHASESPDI
ncbi:MAG: ATP-grasp domain-containing protein [Hyphomicrobiaceae bacterium]|nr:ATP-grasp domain-containing protein [Hyphomicrobiaceae bacterium]